MTTKPRRIHATWALALCFAPLAMAATERGSAYRCHNGAGQTVYSQWPCTNPAPKLDFKDDRTEAQLRQSMENRQRDVLLANRVARERKHAERVSASVPARALLKPSHATASGLASTVGKMQPRYRRKGLFTAKKPRPPLVLQNN